MRDNISKSKKKKNLDDDIKNSGIKGRFKEESDNDAKNLHNRARQSKNVKERESSTYLAMILKQLARTVAIFMILFLAIFAFDEPIFSLGFLVHLVPSLIVIGVLIPSWVSRSYGCISFFALFIISILFFGTYHKISSFFMISFPFLMISGFFGVSYNLNKDI